MPELRTSLLRGESAVCVWGLGYVGYSSACFWASRGVWVVGVEPDAKKAELIALGKCPVGGMDVWLEAASVSSSPKIQVFGSSARIPDRTPIGLHCVAVPTEINGEPWIDPLLDVAQSISYRYGDDAIVMIESTVSPLMIDMVQEKCPGIRLVAAPRRDWFDSPDKHLGTLPRLIGADDKDLLATARNALGIICSNLVSVDGLRKAALVKIVENDLRHVELMYAQDLARAIGDKYDVRDLLLLASSKWNVPLLRPSIGVGGACIPLAGRYLKQIADVELSAAAQRSSAIHTTDVVKMLSAYRKVAFYGIGYKASAPYVSSSPATWLLNMLHERMAGFGVESIGVFPTDDTEASVIRSRFPRVELLHPDTFGGGFYRALVLPVGTLAVRKMTEATFRSAQPYSMILDNECALSHLPDSLWEEIGTRYIVPGQCGWLSLPSS
jgi:nucleotide sugar dehydrogenase